MLRSPLFSRARLKGLLAGTGGGSRQFKIDLFTLDFSISAITQLGLYNRGELVFCLLKIIWVNLAFKRCQWAFKIPAWGFMLILTVTNYGSAMQAALPYLLDAPRARWENIFGRLTSFICLRKNHLLWPWRKSHRPFCEASLRLCCTVPVWWWEALDLSRIAQPLSGPSVHCNELRRGRLWIAEVVSAFYQNRPGFCAVFPKRSMKSVCCVNTRQHWWSSANSTELWLMPTISWLKPFKTQAENDFCTSACTCMKIEAFNWRFMRTQMWGDGILRWKNVGRYHVCQL